MSTATNRRRESWLPLRARRTSAIVAQVRREGPPPTLQSIYEEHAQFVWLTLQRFGVQPADLDDLAHDVFIVVHRRLDSFDGTSRPTTWLFGICLRVAANYRRRGQRRRELVRGAATDRSGDDVTLPVGGDELLVRREERAIAESILAELSLEKRAAFTMFEIEGLTCQEIADVLGVPIGTIHSRLHAARAQIERIVSERFGSGTKSPGTK